MPKYSLGTRVFHKAKQKWGEVVQVWYDGRQDRYGVWHSGFVWGVPEQGLRGGGGLEKPASGQARSNG